MKCAPNLAHTCGLPDQLVEHFSEAFQGNKADASQKLARSSTSRLPGGKLEGWLKVPRYAEGKRRMEFRNHSVIDPFNNDVIRGKVLKSVGLVLNEFSQRANVEPKLTTYWHKRGE